MTSSERGLSGAEFVSKVYALHRNDFIETLLEYCGDESDFLEFKISIYLAVDDKEKYQDNLYWKYAKEIISIANTRGGVFIIGVEDSTHKVYPFEHNDPHQKIKNKDLDAYIRDEIYAHLFPQNNLWRTYKSNPAVPDQKVKTKEYLIDTNLSDLTTGIRIPYQGHVIYGYIIRPANDIIKVHVKSFSSGQPCQEPDIVPYRTIGHVGRCLHKTGTDEISKYCATRDIKSLILKGWIEEIATNIKINKYYESLSSSVKKGIPFFAEPNTKGTIQPESEHCQYVDREVVGLLPSVVVDDDFSQTSHTTPVTLQDETDSSENFPAPIVIRRNLFDVLDSYQHIIITGKSGAGKTTSLQQYIFHKYSSEPHHCYLFLFIKLGQWKDSNSSVEGLVETQSGFTNEDIKRLDEANNLCLILDALNECPSQLLPSAILSISHFISTHSKTRVIISSRSTADVVGLTINANFEIQPLSKDQQLDILCQRLHSQKTAEEFLAQLYNSPNGEHMGSNPMLLRLIVDNAITMDDGSFKIPTTRGQLYRRWTRMWYLREYNKSVREHDELPILPESDDIVAPSGNDIISILAKMAFASRLLGQKGTIKKSIAIKSLGRFSDMVIKRLCDNLLLTDSHDNLTFIHETFQEYLCGEYIAANPDSISQIAHPTLSEWGMPLAYAFELISENHKPFPLILRNSATSMSPWFGLAANGVNRDFSGTNESVAGIIKRLITSANSNQWEEQDSLLLASLVTSGCWYPANDALYYFINTSNGLRSRWESIEKALATAFLSNYKKHGIWKSTAETFLRSLIVFKFPADNSETSNQYVELYRQLDISLIALLYTLNPCDPNKANRVIQGRMNGLRSHLGLEEIIILTQSKFADKSEFTEIILEKINKVLPAAARRMIDAGLTTPEVFKRRIPDWATHKRSRVTMFALMPKQLFDGTSFQDDTHEILLSAQNSNSPKKAALLIKKGMFTPADFRCCIRKWESQHKIGHFICMVATGIYTKDEAIAEARKFRHILHKSPEMTLQFIKLGVYQPYACNDTSGSYSNISHPIDLLNAITNTRGKKFNAEILYVFPSDIGKFSSRCIARVLGLETIIIFKPRTGKTISCGDTLRIELDIKPLATKEGVFIPQYKHTEESGDLPQPTNNTQTEQNQRTSMNQTFSTNKFSRQFDEYFSSRRSFSASKKIECSPPSDISIYIDETWPGIQDEDFKNTGVIGGIVWTGPIDYNKLKHIPTHLRREGGGPLKHLLKCDSAFPFVFPITFPKDFNPNENKYLSLVEDALMVLIGWILPKPSCETSLSIYLEHFGKFGDNHDGTAHFQTILDTIKKQQREDRFGNYKINTVKWVPKDFEYVPYGDLVSYLCAQTPGAKQMAREFKLTSWGGFLPFEESVLTTLRELDAPTPNAFMDALLSFTDICRGSNLFTSIVKNALQRAKTDQAFCTTYLSRIEQAYTDKSHALTTLNALAEPFLNEFNEESFLKNPCLLLKRHLIDLQKANHNGNPESIGAESAAYQEARKRALRLAPDLVVHSDLNLAVHYYDLFQFQQGADTVEQWLTEPSFEYLPLSSQGKLFSSLGQSMAMLGKSTDADTYFNSALEKFSQESYACATELEQTSIYRATNIATLDTASAISILESLVGKSITETCSNQRCIIGKPFIEHLLVKLLYLKSQEQDYLPVIKSYLKNCRSLNIKSDVQHPWELILFYRVLLAYSINEKDRSLRLNELASLYAKLSQRHQMGATLKLIKAFTDIACYLICDITPDKPRLLEYISTIKSASPELKSAAERLVGIYENRDRASVEELWKTLPFNYK